MTRSRLQEPNSDRALMAALGQGRSRQPGASHRLGAATFLQRVEYWAGKVVMVLLECLGDVFGRWSHVRTSSRTSCNPTMHEYYLLGLREAWSTPASDVGTGGAQMAGWQAIQWGALPSMVTLAGWFTGCWSTKGVDSPEGQTVDQELHYLGVHTSQGPWGTLDPLGATVLPRASPLPWCSSNQ